MRGHQQGDQSSVRSPSLSPHTTPLGSNSDLVDSTSSAASESRSSVEVIHRRSHSAELVDMENPPTATAMFVDPKYSASLTEPLNLKEARAQQLGRVSTSPDRLQTRMSLTGSGTNLSKTDRSSSQGSLRKLNSNNNTVQQIPSKLVSSTSVPGNSSSTGSLKQNKQSSNKSVLPLNLAESSKKVSKEQSSSSAKTPNTNKKGDVIYF